MRFRLPILILSSMLFNACSSPEKEIQLLIYSKTEGYRHASIETGVEVIKGIAQSKGYLADHTEDATLFTNDNLKKYSAVIFLNTTGNVLNKDQQDAFKEYIQAGGGFVGIHSATDTEEDWHWYGGLVGAYFDSHPQIQEASLVVVEPDHPATAHLPTRFKFTDEWYNFHSLSPDITPILRLDESSYQGGTHGDNHPAAWYQEYDGGRSFYTALGHGEEMLLNPLLIEHIAAGIDYAVEK